MPSHLTLTTFYNHVKIDRLIRNPRRGREKEEYMIEEKQQGNGTRQSNMELLRIVAIFMIIVFHIAYHGVRVQLTDATSIEYMQNGWFNEPVFFKKLLLLETLMPLGKTGNVIFMLISGYFLAERKEVPMGKQLKKILSQMAVVTVVIILASTYYLFHYDELFDGMIGVSLFNSGWWFAGYYIGIILVAGLFLNKFLNKFTKEQYTTFLLALFALFSVGWLGKLLSGLSSSLRVFVCGVFLYALGGYIKKYNPFEKIPVLVFWGGIIGTYLLVWLSYYNKTMVNINTYYIYESTKEFKQSVTTYSDWKIVPIILGVCIFEIGRRVKIPNVPMINFISSASFMIYLMHDNGFVRTLFQKIDWITLYYYDPKGFFILILYVAFLVYLFGFSVYLIYYLVRKLFS